VPKIGLYSGVHDFTTVNLNWKIQFGVEWNRVHYYWGHHLAYCTSPGWWMMMSVQQSVEWLAGETEVFGGNLPHCRFVHHKSHMTWPGLQPGPPRWETSD
jgi:hypothetical protein